MRVEGVHFGVVVVVKATRSVSGLIYLYILASVGCCEGFLH